ncbi:MAG: YceI family protein [bacterium]|nr:YceI family protein [bacterium]MBK9777678.1 YceI family protein [bacterium]
MRRLLLIVVFLLGLAGSRAPAGAATGRWDIVPGDSSRIEFVSKAPLETITGRTKQVSGGCTFDPEKLEGDIVLEVAVEMASFDTGLGKRNQHMRENHLHTDRFPRSWLRGGAVKATPASSLPVGGTVSVEFVGELELHGVRRPVVCTIVLERPTADALTATAELPVKLADYDIARPQMLLLKLAEEQKVRVALALRRTS